MNLLEKNARFRFGASTPSNLSRVLKLGACVLVLAAGTALASEPAPSKPAPSKPGTKQPSKPAQPQVGPVSLEKPAPAKTTGAKPASEQPKLGPDHGEHGAADGPNESVGHGAPQKIASPAARPVPAAPARGGKPASPVEAHHAGGGVAGEIDGNLTPEEALAALQEGNARWLSGQTVHPSTGMLRRQTTASEGQHPFVTVLTCADSRLPVERVFDRGVGEVFVVRVAGNIADQALAGTVEYGVGHLGTKLLVVMGHSKCGAVKATVENASVGPNVGSILERVRPAVERAKRLNPDANGDGLVDAAVRENVWQTVFDLYKTSPELASAAQAGKLKVVGAVLDVSSGRVEWLGEHPWQEALVAALAKPSGVSEPLQHADGGAGAGASSVTGVRTETAEHGAGH